MLAANKPSTLAIIILFLAANLGACKTGPTRLQQMQAQWAAEDAKRTAQREHDDRDMAAWRERPSAAELAAADCGPPPPSGWKAALESAVRAGLRDPDSGTFRISEPERSATKAGEGAPFEFMWKVYYEVNARNGFGGYAGFESSAVYFKNGNWISLDEHLRRQREWRESRPSQ